MKKLHLVVKKSKVFRKKEDVQHLFLFLLFNLTFFLLERINYICANGGRGNPSPTIKTRVIPNTIKTRRNANVRLTFLERKVSKRTSDYKIY